MFSSDNLKGINVFVSVANAGSFAAAAEKLNLTSSAVSKSISRLEARLQRRLFHRTTRTLSLTDAGMIYYRTCTNVLAELEETELSLALDEKELHGRIRIDLPAAFGRLHVLPLILEFANEFPRLQPHITLSDRFIDPVQEGVDIVVRIGGPDAWPSTLGHRYLGAQRLVFCASPEYLARHGTPQNIAELEQHQCIGYAEQDGTVLPWYFRGGAQGEMERRVMTVCMGVGDGEGEMMAAMKGYGIAQLPTWLVQHRIAAGALVEVLPELATDSLPVNLVWLKHRESLPKVTALLALFTDNLTPAGRKSRSENQEHA